MVRFFDFDFHRLFQEVGVRTCQLGQLLAPVVLFWCRCCRAPQNQQGPEDAEGDGDDHGDFHKSVSPLSNRFQERLGSLAGGGYDHQCNV